MDSPSLDQLRKQQEELVAKEDYAQAEEVMRQIEELMRQSTSTAAQELRSKHRGENKDLEASFAEEKSSLSRKREEERQQLLSEHKKQQEEMLQKQKERYSKERERLESTVNLIFKPSAHLLNLVECKEKAVRTKKYIEAESLKHSIAELRRQEEAAFAQERRDKISKSLQQLQQQFDRERERLELKQQENLEEFAINLKRDHDVLAKKFANLRNDMVNTQKIELNILCGRQTSGVGHSPEKTRSTFTRSMGAQKP